MKRYIKIYLQIIKINIVKLFIYRANFFTSLLSSVGWGVVGIFTMYLLTLRIGSAYGWSREDLIILAAIYPAFSGIFYMLFARNIGNLPEIIHSGELDSVLVKPIDSQFFVSTLSIDFIQIFRVILSASFIIIYGHFVPIHITIFSLTLSILLCIAGISLLYSIWFLVMTIALWFSTLSNLKDLLYTLVATMRFPADMFYKKQGTLFLILIPFSLALTVPVKVMLERSTLLDLVILLLISSIFFISSRFFWKFALRFYTSASG